MPAGAINALENIVEHAKPKPYFILILLVIAIFFAIYSQRIFGIKSGYYNLFIVIVVMGLMSIVIASTIIHNFDLGRNAFLEYLNDTFNSPSSRNFLIIFSFLLFVMFIYETAQYDNNDPQNLTDKLLLGHNEYISNRFWGLMLIIIFGIYTAYSIYITTSDK